MSLIRVRRERKAGDNGPRRSAPLWKLVVALILVILLIWYLSRYV